MVKCSHYLQTCSNINKCNNNFVCLCCPDVPWSENKSHQHILCPPGFDIGNMPRHNWSICSAPEESHHSDDDGEAVDIWMLTNGEPTVVVAGPCEDQRPHITFSGDRRHNKPTSNIHWRRAQIFCWPHKLGRASISQAFSHA